MELVSLKSLHNDTSALECESCSVVMDDYVWLKYVHAQVVSQLESVSKELVELKVSSSTSERCHVCPKLVPELIVRSFMIKNLKTTGWAKPQHTVSPPPCVSCISLKDKCFKAREENVKLNQKITYLTALLREL